ncbi:MAG TPA: outer membrane protein assembly factor BamA [Thermodesulfovibrio thiophilus]|nr:outer membrane protein assembly factor BamA [Thermodesulfovibrio thiophilus]
MRLSFVLSFVSILFIAGLVYANEYIKKIEIEGLKSISEQEFLYLLGVKENESFNRDEITQGIKRVFLKGLFDDIVVEHKEQVMKITVKEKPLINKIEIKGNEYFPEKFFIKLLSFKNGDRLKEVEIKRSQHNIEEALGKRGFINSHVRIDRIFNENYVNITIFIEEGEPLIIKNIIWEGNFDEYVKAFLSLNIGDPFDTVLVEDFITTAQKYFTRQGLIDSEITYSFKEGELILKLVEGKKFNIEFKGVESLSTIDLKNIAIAHFQDKLNENIIKDSVNSLITFYRSNGFLDVKIIPLLEESEDEWKIIYFINEGTRKLIEKIDIETSISTKELKNILFNKENEPYNPEELENDRQRIEEYLKTKGYYYAKAFPPKIKEENDRIQIFFKVEEGKQIKIKFINLEIKNDLLKSEALDVIQKYNEVLFNDAIFIEIKRKLREIYIKYGYSEVKVEGNYEIKNDEANINFQIDPGNKKYFGKSIILGNEKTKTSFIYQRLLSKEQEPYDPYIIEEERQALYKTGLFSRIDIQPQVKDGSVDLIYNIEEAPAGAFEFGFGYGDYEKLKGVVGFSYINLFGLNKQIFSRAEISSLEKRIYVTYMDPWLWKDLTFKSSVLFEKVEVKNIDTDDTMYRIRRYGISTGFEKKFLEHFKAELLYEATYAKTWDVMPEVVLSDKDIGKLFISGIKASLIYDSRDNPFDPKEGWLTGATSKLSNEFFGSELNFLKSSFYVNKYTELIRGLVLATSLRGGWAWLYGTTDYLPIYERYFLGGRDTVRGYDQNTLGPRNNRQPTGGNAFLMGNLELRTSLGKNFFLVNFLDFGNVWKRASDVDATNIKYTTGAGLRYKTPIGPLRIDYGYKLNRKAGESRGEIHFSIGHAF